MDFSFIGQVDLVFGNRHMRRFRYPFHKQEHGDQQTYFNGDGQVENNGQEECDKQYGNVRFRILQ